MLSSADNSADCVRKACRRTENMKGLTLSCGCATSYPSTSTTTSTFGSMRAALSSSRASAAPASTRPPAASAVVLHATRRCPCAPFSSPAAFPCAAGRVSSVVVLATGKGFGAPKPKPAVAKKEAGVKAKLLDPSAKCPCGSGSSYEVRCSACQPVGGCDAGRVRGCSEMKGAVVGRYEGAGPFGQVPMQFIRGAVGCMSACGRV